jgi:hypothetical protein
MQDEVKLLKQDPSTGTVRVVDAPASPALETGSEIYGTFFGMDELYPSPLGQALRSYSLLANDPDRSLEDEKCLKALRRQLEDAGMPPSWEPVPRQTLKAR